MTFKFLRTSAAFVFGTVLLTGWLPGQVQQNAPASPYGGSVVEDIVARVNNQIITQSDYDRAMSEMDQDMRQQGATMQQMSESHKDLLRHLIDQQLWLSKGKELGITGDTELVKRLDEIRKQYNLATIEDLEQAAKQQGVSFEDFKQNIQNQIITQDVMRQEVGAHIQFTPGEAQRYYEAHKQDFTQPESERLSEILIGADSNDPAKVQAAKAKADDIEARLHSGGDFSQLARSFSDGTTASSGGDLGVYKHGQLGSVLEDKTFPLKTGQYTEPILTRQGYIILKVVQHTAGGPAPYKDVQEQVEEALYMNRMEPAIQAYLTKMRNQAAIFIKPGYTDTAATEAELHPSITFSAYVPPAPKKKAKVERTRFRESTHTFRQKGGQISAPPEAVEAPTAEETGTTAANVPPASASAASTTATPATVTSTKSTSATATPATTGKKQKKKKGEAASQKPGKKEKIRYGQAPRETLPTAANGSTTENAGALPETADNAQQPANPLEPTRSTVKERFSDRARTEHSKKKKQKGIGAQTDSLAPAPPNAAEVADQQTQSAPLGLGGNTTPTGKKKKKTATTTSEKTRMSQKKKEENTTPPPQPTPVPPVPGAPAPAAHPDAPQPQPSPQPQQ
ncbi:MAG TPA: peptidylprolyl isomerase [Terracidiphilus sp.]|nr:peptidylprolyl isomerase [Terracidiphilus sp.]